MNNSIHQSARWLAMGPSQKLDLLRSHSSMVRRLSTDSQNPDSVSDIRRSLSQSMNMDELMTTGDTPSQHTSQCSNIPDFGLLQSRLEEVQSKMDNGEQQVRGAWQLWETDPTPYGSSYGTSSSTRGDEPFLHGNLAVPVVQESRLFNFNQMAATLEDMRVETLL
ncbi:hypothetical protein MCUN1_003290 [Malassezia cuniculi]|uniref:Uncharacterized protein n=1 Tax=Malassezia cuniculi TaxID=948313 RepID=A0AAF0ET95_9BASI|nr:hypothetical protein MCUN1_003290 [Malassezia cuniculi]